VVVLDTSIIIDHLRQRPSAESHLDKIVKKMPKESLAVAMITIQELYIGTSTTNEQAEQLLLATITPLKILAYTYEIAQLAGEISRDTKRPIELADATIAATAITNGLQLATLNKKDFVGIEGLEII